MSTPGERMWMGIAISSLLLLVLGAVAGGLTLMRVQSELRIAKEEAERIREHEVEARYDAEIARRNADVARMRAEEARAVAEDARIRSESALRALQMETAEKSGVELPESP